MVRFGLLTVAITAALSSAAMAQDTPVGRSRDDGAPPAIAPAPVKPAAAAKVSDVASEAPPVRLTPSTPNSNDPTGDQIADWLRADANPAQPLADAELLPEPRQIHGEVTATISNRGYGGSAAVSMPLGQASELDVAVGAAHVRTPWGNRNPKSVAVGLYLDGGDVARWLSPDKCKTPRWGVRLKDDPQVEPDGSCYKADAAKEAAR